MEKIVIAQLSVKENSMESFLKVAAILVEKSNNESGCLIYRLLKDVNKPNTFIVYEKYANQQAVEIHNSSAHLKDFLNAASTLLKDTPKIDVY
jgi:quinol monooxygenase YgiN